MLAKDDSQRMQAAGELGAAFIQARQFDRAQRSLTQALALVQGEQRAHYELGLGNLASLQKDTAAALGHYQRAEQFAPLDPVVRGRVKLNRARSLPVPARLARLQAIEADLDALAPPTLSTRTTDPSRLKAASGLYLNLGHQAQGLGAAGNPLALRSLERARALAANLPNDRLNLEVLDALAQQHQLSKEGVQLIARATVQRSADRLLALDGLAVGGINTVRGFRENELVRDQGEYFNIELDWPIAGLVGGQMSGNSRVHLVPFIDPGSAHNLSGPTQALSSLGVALRAQWQGLQADLTVAKRLSAVDQSPGAANSLQGQGIHLQIAYKF